MWRDPSTIDFTDGLAGLLMYVNEVTFGWFSRLILIGVFILVISGYYKSRDDIIGGAATAGVATFIVAMSFWLWDFVDVFTFATVIGVMLVSAAALLIDRNG